jgi:AcrR family transcriptional regulator
MATAKNKKTPQATASREERERSIIVVATRLLAKYGYADCEMERVAADLKIAKGTLYLYFKSKEALFFACVDAGMRQLQTAVQLASQEIENPLERIAAAVRAYLEFFDQHPELTELFIQERANFRQRKRPSYFVHRDAMRGPWRELYVRLQTEGVLRNDLPAERILDTLGSLVYGTMFTNFFAGRSTSLEEQFQAMLTIIQHGMLTKLPQLPS